jgi:hypothetical protein
LNASLACLVDHADPDILHNITKDGLTSAQATLKASNDPRFSAALRREREAKFKPEVL